jgi:hypothetical protein
MRNELEYSELVTNRMIECLDNNKIFMHHELQIVDYSLQRLNLKTISQYAREKGISPNGVKDRIKRGKVMSITVSGTTFVAS